jgi:putative glycerol-1-phosphate prenyltransferase
LKILKQIQEASFNGRKQLAILIDPDDAENIAEMIGQLKKNPPDFIFVGGSIIQNDTFDAVVIALKKAEIAPVVIFPGDASQISKKADGILLLSLISGRNAEYLIGQHVKAAPVLKKWGKEIIPTSYLLIDGGNITSVQKVSNTAPLSQDNIEAIANTAIAGEQMGHQLVYLEAGSGAVKEVSSQVIRNVKDAVNVPLIVGGGIRSKERALLAWQSGATVVVIGTAFEKGELNLEEVLNQRNEWKKS